MLTFLNPENDPLGAGYHIIQSKIAIGSGGLYGKGWLNGTQSQLNFLPERSTDFIFAAYAEEFGLIGILALLGVYLLVIMRGLLIAALLQPTGIMVMLDEYARGGKPEHGMLFMCTVMFLQQFLTFLGTRRTVLLFTSLVFGTAASVRSSPPTSVTRPES